MTDLQPASPPSAPPPKTKSPMSAWAKVILLLAVTFASALVLAMMFVATMPPRSPGDIARYEQERLARQKDREEREREAKSVAAEKERAAAEESVSVEGRAKRIRSAIVKALGKSNRKGVPETSVDYDGTTISVKWPINDNLTENMIKRGAKTDVTDVLKAVAGSDVPFDNLRILGTFSLIDRFGNSTESLVLNLSYKFATVKRINFDNFLPLNAYDIADEKVLHSLFGS